MVLYIGITAFIALFGIVYEQFSHHVDTFYMWFAWIWPLIFGFVPYLLLYVLKAPRVPGLLSECFYNLGVALLTVRSVFKGVIIIYNTTNDGVVLVYTILTVVSLSIGVILYITGLLINKKEESH